MFCRECGNQLEGMEDFCPMCGTKVIKDTEEAGQHFQGEMTDHGLHPHEVDPVHPAENPDGRDSIESESNGKHGPAKREDEWQNEKDKQSGDPHPQESVINPDEQGIQESSYIGKSGNETDLSAESGGHSAYPEEPPYDPYSKTGSDRGPEAGFHTESAAGAEIHREPLQDAPSKKSPLSKKELLLAFGIPAASLLLFSGTAFAIHTNEKNANQKAESLHYEGEEYALDGNYDQALKKLSEASKLRPENSVIQRVKREVESARKVEKTLASVDQKIKGKDFGEAKDALNNVRNDIQTRKSPIFDPLESRTSDQETDLVIEMVKTESAEMDSVEEIGEQLKKIYTLKTAKAEEVKGQLIKKIVSISQKTSDEYMKKNNFDEAISALRSGLRYTNYENAELTSRLSELEDAKASYSGSLPVFLEKHWAVINSKTMRSKKPPLQLGKVIFEEDQFNYVVTGKVKSLTKSTLNNPTFYLKIYDKNGKFLYNEDVPSKEMAIKSGQEAEFFFFLDKEYGKDIKVVIDQVAYRK